MGVKGIYSDEGAKIYQPAYQYIIMDSPGLFLKQ